MQVSLIGEGSYIDIARIDGDLHLDRYYHRVIDADVLERPTVGISNPQPLFMLYQRRSVRQTPLIADTHEVEHRVAAGMGVFK